MTMLTSAEFALLETVAQGQREVAERLGQLRQEFAAHCAAEETNKIRDEKEERRCANRAPMLAAVASWVAAAVAVAALVLHLR